MTEEIITQDEVKSFWKGSVNPLSPPEPDPVPEEYIRWQRKIFNEVNNCSDIHQIEHVIVHHLMHSIVLESDTHYKNAVKDLLDVFGKTHGQLYGLEGVSHEQ